MCGKSFYRVYKKVHSWKIALKTYVLYFCKISEQLMLIWVFDGLLAYVILFNASLISRIAEFKQKQHFNFALKITFENTFFIKYPYLRKLFRNLAKRAFSRRFFIHPVH
jgi:hypothetical protein